MTRTITIGIVQIPNVNAARKKHQAYFAKSFMCQVFSNIIILQGECLSITVFDKESADSVFSCNINDRILIPIIEQYHPLLFLHGSLCEYLFQ